MNKGEYDEYATKMYDNWLERREIKLHNKIKLKWELLRQWATNQKFMFVSLVGKASSQSSFCLILGHNGIYAEIEYFVNKDKWTIVFKRPFSSPESYKMVRMKLELEKPRGDSKSVSDFKDYLRDVDASIDDLEDRRIIKSHYGVRDPFHIIKREFKKGLR